MKLPKFLFPFGWSLPHSIVLVFVLFGTLMYTMENINGRFWLNDFQVYYSAAKAFLEGNPVYGLPFGLDTGYYKYGPETLLFFLPSTLLPYFVASTIHFWLTLALTASLFLFHGKTLWEKGGKYFLVFAPVFASIVVLLSREMHLGNVNILLLATLTLCIYLFEKKRFWFSALLLAIIILTKPYFGIFILPFVFRKHWKYLLQISLSALVLILLILPFKGFHGTIELHLDWWRAMMGHSEMLTSDQTIFSLIHKATGVEIASKFSLPLLFVFGLIISTLKRKDTNIRLSLFLLIAIIPNVVITDLEHFLFVLPLIFHHLVHWKEKTMVLNILFCLCLPFLMLEGFFDYGSLGLANLGIVIISLLPLKK